MVVDGWLLVNTVCTRTSSAASAGVKNPSSLLPIAGSKLAEFVSAKFKSSEFRLSSASALLAGDALARFAAASASSACLTASISASRCCASIAISIKLRGLNLLSLVTLRVSDRLNSAFCNTPRRRATSFSARGPLRPSTSILTASIMSRILYF